MAYSAQQKAQAKALALAFGNVEEARRVLEDHWDGATPTSQVIRLWAKDPAIEADIEFFQEFSDEQKRRVLGSIARLLGPLEERVREELESGKALELLNATKAWGIVVDKLRPDTTPAYAANFAYVDNRTVRRDPMMLFGPKVIMPYGPKEPEEERTPDRLSGVSEEVAEVRELPAPTEAQPPTAPRSSVAKRSPAVEEPPSMGSVTVSGGSLNAIPRMLPSGTERRKKRVD